MGKGDKRTRRGKIYNGSYGKRRPGNPKKAGTAGQAGSGAARTGKTR